MRVVLLCFLVAGFSMPGHAQVLDAMVARVDREIITWSRVVQEGILLRLTEEEPATPSPEAVRGVLIERYLLIAEAQKLRLEVNADTARRAVDQLASRSGGQLFWDAVGKLGLHRADLEERAARQELVRQYLALRRELTFVPESEVRAYFFDKPQIAEGRSLADARDEIRSLLAERKHQEELEQWVNRQVSEGRVRILPLPAAQ